MSAQWPFHSCLSKYFVKKFRICVVDSQLNIVYHTFVMPKNPIRNYLTMYSGITKEMLEGVTTTIEDVQMAISNILPPGAFLNF